MKKIIAIFLLMVGLSFGQSNLIILNSTFGTTAAYDTLTTGYFSIADYSNIEIGFSYDDSLSIRVVVNYYGGSASTFIASTTADTLGSFQAAGGFAGKVLRSALTNIIPGAAMIRVNVHAVPTKTAFTGTLRINLIRKK